MKNLNELKKAAETVVLPEAVIPASAGRGKMSFSIVNSKKNGKRITITNTLANALGVTDSISILPIPEEEVFLIAKALPFERAEECSLTSDESHKISYTTRVVLWLTDCFGFDYSDSTSKTFQEINIDKFDDGTIVAIISNKEKSKGVKAS